MDLSVIIPSYNEERNVGIMHERLTKTLSEITDSYEMIFVNDCSKECSRTAS